MMCSLFVGVSGLKNHQTRMDTIGNNIANVNTPGFKKSRVVFQDMLSQTLKTATAPTNDRAGTNPVQTGLGVSVASIDVIHTNGNFQSTGRPTDLSIEGTGYFVVGKGEKSYYTRAGNFEFNRDYTFYHGSSGYIVKGILADALGNIDPTAVAEDIYLQKYVSTAPRATSQIDFAKNIDSRVATRVASENATHTSGSADVVNLNVPFNSVTVTHSDGTQLVEGAADGFSIDYATGELTIAAGTVSGDYTVSYNEPNYSLSVLAYDSKGDTHTVNLHLTKTGVNEWEVNTTVDNVFSSTGQGTLFFDPVTGDLLNSTVSNTIQNVPGAADLDFAYNFENIKEYAGEFTITYTGQDGFTAGFLEEVNVDSSGILNGSYSNGLTRSLAQLTIASFSNPAGLHKAGNNLYEASNNSGEPDQGVPGTSGRGIINPETLEMSNVDLSQEFVEMIITQRGFQANSRIITTSDQILEELVNLRR